MFTVYLRHFGLPNVECIHEKMKDAKTLMMLPSRSYLEHSCRVLRALKFQKNDGATQKSCFHLAKNQAYGEVS